MSHAPSNPLRHGWLLGLALLPLGGAGASDAAAPRDEATRRPVVCEAAVQHPIQVNVVALDPVSLGANVRLRLTTSSRLDLSRSEARVVSAGSATLLGRPRAALGRMTPQREAAAEFTVRMPAAGERALVQFRVEGEGPAGRIGRGATFNLLPSGPTRPARIVSGAAGRAIAEYPARRMP